MELSIISPSAPPLVGVGDSKKKSKFHQKELGTFVFSNMHLTEVSQPINEDSGVLKHFKMTGIFLHYIPNLNIALLINLNCKEIIAVLDVT